MEGNKGFTLIELILVVIIIGILAGIVVVNYHGRVQEAQIGKTKADIELYRSAIDLYALDHGDTFPTSLNDLMGGKRDYVREMRRDPWNNDYVYLCPGKKHKNSYDLYSKGPDRTDGTEDDIQG